MPQIFINFRAQDEPGFAALLQRELSRTFGRSAVFHAGTTIRPGDDFEVRLLDGVRRAAVLLAVIGPRWLTAVHSPGVRLLDRDTDWVRREIAEAFAQDVRVVPILVDDTERLTNARLPSDISPLSRCQYLRLRHNDLEYDLARIVGSLVRLTGGRQPVTPLGPQ
jgi:TIR domain